MSERTRREPVRAVGRRGGVPARRAVVRWAWRLFRREWRQQALVIALLALAVALAVGGATAAYNSARSTAADFGSADHLLVSELSDVSDAQLLDGYLADAEEWFGSIDVIGRRRIPVPGSTETLELRAQDPDGAYTGPMLALREGRYPTRVDELAVTDGVAQIFPLTTGDTLALDGNEWTVVGLVENPSDLDDEFVLVAPSADLRPAHVTVLVKGSEARVMSFPATRDPGPGFFESRDATVKGTAGVGALAASTVVLLLVCLVATAGFVVVAQRRLRQLGMLAAMGATRKHLRLVVVANGTVVGATAAVLGTAIGLAGWIAVAPRMETVARHRIDRFDVPWWLVGLGMVLAVVAASGAAWWPARTMSRVPVTRALSGRPPRPRAARRSLLLAVPLLVIGVACLVTGIDTANDEIHDLLVIAGAVAIPLGIVLLCPLAIRILVPVATRLPIAARLALRDLARYQARSGAALAAISLGLGIAVTIVVAAAASQYGAAEGNLSDRQLLVRIDEGNEVGIPVDVPEQTPAELERFGSAVDQVATTLNASDVVALDVAVDPAGAVDERSGEVLRPPIALGREVDQNTIRDIGPLYVATAAAVGHVGLDAASLELDPDTEILTPEKGPLFLVNVSDPMASTCCMASVRSLRAIDVPGYSSAPRSFIVPEAVRRNGWETARAGWLIEAREPLTSEQLAQAREVAADASMTVEVRRGQEGLSQLRSGATAAGSLLGLGILAMTVGLIRSEAANDLRTLTATGASSRIRRTITGVTAGTLAFLGALLGTAGAYAGLGAGYSDDIGQLNPAPIPELVVISVGLPLLAAVAGWLLAGREPPAVARTAIE